MKRRRFWIPAIIVAVVAAIIVIAGPWPIVLFERRSVTKPVEDALEMIDSRAFVASWPLGAGEALWAGWAAVPLRVPQGTPLAGYGDRRGEPSTGYHDQLEIGALALGTTDDAGHKLPRAAIITSDLLVVPEPIAERVRSQVDLPILFTASHTHSGPGAAMRGLVARAFGGRYDQAAQNAIVDAMVTAVDSAAEALAPAVVRAGSVSAPELIRNRTREETAGYPLTDPVLDVITFDSAESRLTLLRYSAHSTVIGSRNMEFSAGYPGYLRTLAEERFGGEVFFMAGAVGSMGPRPPEGEDDFARAEAMARKLDAEIGVSLDLRTVRPAPAATRRTGDGTADPESTGSVLAVADIPLQTPPVQLRIAGGLRLSPLFLAMNGVNRHGHMTAIMLGDLLIIGFSGDLSGEIGTELRGWGAARGLQLVPVSFAGAYQGYISPDAYYKELRENGSLAYETGIMSWMGPGQEAFFVTTAHAVVEALQSISATTTINTESAARIP